MDKTCETCGNLITGRGASRFCSRICSAASRKTNETKLCEYCGQEFAIGGGASRGRKARSRRFCCRAHASAARNPKKERICKGCGITFVRSGHNQPQYHSVECYRAHTREVNKLTLTCDRCGKEFERWRSQRVGKKHYCSGECRAAGRVYATGAAHPNWKGGARWIDKESGYVLTEIAGVRKAEHRLVMEQHLGRALEPDETVHHIDGVRSHNWIENLQLRKGQHGKGTCLRCSDCGSTNIIKEKIYV